MTTTPKRYTPSGLNHQFSSEYTSFADYVARTKKMIANARVDLASSTADIIIEANAPFEWQPIPSRAIIGASGKQKYGILLVHGLLDSPFAMRELAEHFLNLGFLVRSVLLPGHGTRPGDLLKVECEAWIDTMQFAIDCFEQDVECLYLLGVSAGANLCISQAIDNPFIRGLFLISPLIKLRTRFSFLATWFRTLGNFHNKMNWFRLADDKDYAKYESIPYNVPYQASTLCKLLAEKKRNKKLMIPVFMALSEDDETIDSAAAKEFFMQQTHPANKLVLYNSTPMVIDTPQIEHRTSFFPELNIVNFSHVCLHASPDNPHYGHKGDYLPRLHMNKKTKQADETIVTGALNAGNLKSFSVRRLTYNPDYPMLLKILDNFLMKIC